MNPLPIYRSKYLELFAVKVESEIELPLVAGISAGFPSPAADFIDTDIDLVKYLISNPYTTFFGSVKGNSMKDAGIFDGDVMIVDKSLECSNGDVAVCFLDGEFTVKRFVRENKKCWLVAENTEYQPIEVTSDNELIIWGVVTFTIKKHRCSRS